MKDSWKGKYVLLITIAISVISAFMLLFLIICFGILPIGSIEGSMLVGLTLPTIISLYLFPKLCQKILISENGKTLREKDKIWRPILCMVGFALLYGIIFRNEFKSASMMCMIMFHYIIVSLSEEFTYRKLILGLLKARYKIELAIVMSAFMFSFILHINENMAANLLIRFPLGICLGYIAVKTNTIAYTIVLHTIYNLIVLVL